MYNLLHDEKDIDSIFFYAINDNINYLGFFYTTNNIRYKIDYKDINFKEAVERIIKVYNTLKDNKKIKLIGNLTEDIINGKININTSIKNKTIINENEYDYLSMFSYIKLIIEHTLKVLNIKSELNYQDHIFSYLNYNENNSLIKPSFHNLINIPITFYKTNKGYKLKYKIYKEKKEHLFDTDINIYNKSIIVNIKNKEYNGEIIFDKLNIDNTIRYNKNNTLIYLENIDNNLTDKDIKLINKVFNLIDINYEINGIKTTGDNYILYNKTNDYEYNMHLNIENDVIRIKLKQLKKYQKDKIDFKVEEENYDYLITKYNNKYILIQQKYLLSNNSNYEYKKNINKSKYYLLENDNKINNIIDCNIINITEINNEIKELESIKKLTKNKGEV